MKRIWIVLTLLYVVGRRMPLVKIIVSKSKRGTRSRTRGRGRGRERERGVEMKLDENVQTSFLTFALKQAKYLNETRRSF